MDLYEAMTTGGASRAFHPDSVPDQVIHGILDHARFAPSGANLQGWNVIVVKNMETRHRLQELYQLSWREYIAFRDAGQVAFSAGADGTVRVDGIDLELARQTPQPNPLVDNLEKVPVLMMLCVDMTTISFLDIEVKRPSIVGGASIYPFGHNIMLAARNEGLGGVLITIICRQEDEVKRSLNIPDHMAVAGMIVLGRPVRPLRKLTRKSVEQFATVDRFDGEPFKVTPLAIQT